MKEKFKYIYGPVPSRRLGLSLGVSPIPKKTCNYSCIYCQLGRTDKMTNSRRAFFDYNEIIQELKTYLSKKIFYDVITIVGEGEPTLYADLGVLIKNIKLLTSKPVAVISNGALLYDEKVRNDLYLADIVMPSLDSYDEASFRKINRPHGDVKFDKVIAGLIEFSKHFKGILWLETMLVAGFNDSNDAMTKLKTITEKIIYNKIYINTPVRPPAESCCEKVNDEIIKQAVEIFNGISIEKLVSSGFYSEVQDDYQAILSIIKRHPMHQFEIRAFLEGRKCKEVENVMKRLNNDSLIDKIEYKNYITYRLK